ncbi:MAG TPA: zinc-binding dehydrogenase [Acidimicrobiales bacterium]|nr:zinc-binding dehydrogenase [Acidimicrobiales bacterium]
MKAVVQKAFGGVDVLSYEDVPDPVVEPGDVLVRTEVAALNRLDVLQREGPPMLPGFSLPHIAGMDVAGTVVAVGPAAGPSGTGRPLAVGDRVLVNPALECGNCPRCRDGDDGLCEAVRVVGATCPGGYAELCAVPADHAFVLPDHVSFEEAATIPTTYSTAWHALVTVGRLSIGETVLLHGAGSGVSIAAIQLAKRCGARVVATARSDDKLALARRLGADAVVNTATTDLVAACRELTDGRGVDMALDHLGPALFEPTIYALRPRGRLVFVGTTTGRRASFDLPYAYHFGISLVGADPYGAAEFGRMLDFYWHAGFEPVIDSRFSLGDVPAAQARMESGEAAGKILLVP